MLRSGVRCIGSVVERVGEAKASWALGGAALTSLPHRLRSVKMEQRKLSDQANTLVDLSKVSGGTPRVLRLSALPVAARSQPRPSHVVPSRESQDCRSLGKGVRG